MSETVKFEYQALALPGGMFGVFVVHEDAPEWYRLIGTFASKERADQYAEIENMFLEDFDETETWSKMQRAEIASPPALSSPPSAVVPGNFVRRETIEHTHVERREEITVQANGIKYLEPIQPVKEITSAPPEPRDGPYVPLPDDMIADAAQLPTLTPKQKASLDAFCKLVIEKPRFTTGELIAAGGGTAASHLYTLQSKGFIKDAGERGGRLWKIAYRGEPDVAEWQKSATKPEPQLAIHQAEPAEVDLEAVDADDLSATPRAVLAAVSRLYADRIHPIKEPEIVQESGVDETRLPFAFQRLCILNCMRRDSVGSWFPTPRGIELAKAINAKN
jgi:hypothetical protein